MKVTSVVLILAVVAPYAGATNPISKVLDMISDLQAKVLAEGKDCQKTYEEFSEFCEDRSKELSFEIKTQTGQVEDLKATIAEETATAGSLTTKIEELSGETASDDADLEEATAVRAKEQKDFAAEEADLMGIIDSLGRAIGIIEKEMKGGASMMQLKSANSVGKAMSILVQASMISSADGSKLTSLVQSSSDDADAGAPAGEVYENQSGGIVATLQGLFDKAEAQLDELRKKETADIHNFKMLKQSLEDNTKFAKKELAEAKKGLAAAEEKKSEAEGELTVTSKDLAEDTKSLAELHADCMAKANNFEDEVKDRGEELKALATAKKLIVEATSLAQNSVSLFQLQRSRITSRADLVNVEAVQFVRDLAKKSSSAALAQLASQMSSIMRMGQGNGEDVFAKVKSLIADMIEKLEAEAEADATKKAYCDKENAESNAKKEAKEAEVEKLTTSIDAMSAKSASLKEQVSALAKELGELAKAQANMDKVRLEEKADYTKNSGELSKGIKGIQLALKTLTDYYGSADGAGASIISMLEVAESDFTKSLAEMTSTEESAVAEYEAETKENEITKTTKDQDVKYKTKESKGLDKSIAEAKEDLSGVKDELDAVLEYLSKLKGKCFPIPAETYEETVARREKEIAGCKQALTILEGEAFLQKGRRTLRGTQH